MSANVCYLTPDVRARENLEVRGDVLVDRVEVDGGRARAVLLATGERLEADVDWLMQVAAAAGYKACVGRKHDKTRCDKPLGRGAARANLIAGHPYCDDCLRYWWEVESPDEDSAVLPGAIHDLCRAILTMKRPFPQWVKDDVELMHHLKRATL